MCVLSHPLGGVSFCLCFSWRPDVLQIEIQQREEEARRESHARASAEAVAREADNQVISSFRQAEARVQEAAAAELRARAVVLRVLQMCQSLGGPLKHVAERLAHIGQPVAPEKHPAVRWVTRAALGLDTVLAEASRKVQRGPLSGPQLPSSAVHAPSPQAQAQAPAAAAAPEKSRTKGGQAWAAASAGGGGAGRRASEAAARKPIADVGASSEATVPGAKEVSMEAAVEALRDTAVAVEGLGSLADQASSVHDQLARSAREILAAVCPFISSPFLVEEDHFFCSNPFPAVVCLLLVLAGERLCPDASDQGARDPAGPPKGRARYHLRVPSPAQVSHSKTARRGRRRNKCVVGNIALHTSPPHCWITLDTPCSSRLVQVAGRGRTPFRGVAE